MTDENPQWEERVAGVIVAANEFEQQPFWKQAALLSAGLTYLIATRVFIPALIVLAIVWVFGL